MTKEQLLELGLTEEQIPGIFRLNGIDVEKAKSDYEEKEIEVANLKEQVTEANEKIEEFKDLDVDAIKQSADDYKAKYEEATEQAQKDIANLKFETDLEKTISNHDGKNATAIKALLDLEALKESKNQAEDIQQAIEANKTDHDYLYGESKPAGTGGSKGNGANHTPTLEKENYGASLAKGKGKVNTDTSIYEI